MIALEEDHIMKKVNSGQVYEFGGEIYMVDNIGLNGSYTLIAGNGSKITLRLNIPEERDLSRKLLRLEIN